MKKLAIASATAASLLAPAALAEEYNMSAGVDRVILHVYSRDSRYSNYDIEIKGITNQECHDMGQNARATAYSVVAECYSRETNGRHYKVGEFKFNIN